MTDPFDANWLGNLSDEAKQSLRKACSASRFPKGGKVYRLGVPQDRLWCVVEGQVRVLVSTNEMPPVLGHIHAPGAWLGEVEFALSIVSYVEMEAVPGTRTLSIGRKQFDTLAIQHPAIWESVARLASMDLWYATSAANDLVLRTSEKRVAATLLRLSGHRAAIQGNPPLNKIYANQQEVADLANVSRTTASKVLHGFEASGVINLEYGSIRIVMPDALSDVIQD